MLNRILVPLDGSERAESILSQLRPLLRRKDAEVLLARAVPPSAGARANTDPLRSESDAYLRKTAAKLEEQGIRARLMVLDGPPEEALIAAADRERVDLIAMTTHGRTGIARWVLGSITEKVIRSARVPVLVVRSFTIEGQAVAAKEAPFRKILVPTDGSDASKAVIPVAILFAKLFESEVAVLHATPGVTGPPGSFYGSLIEPVPIAPVVNESPPAEEFTRHAAWAFSKAGLKVSTLNVAGDPASQIVDLCKPHGIDLIAIATNGRSGMTRWILGSVTEKVIRAAPVPLLVVRSPGKT